MGVGVVLSSKVHVWDMKWEEAVIASGVYGFGQFFLLLHAHASFGRVMDHPCVRTDELLQQLHILMMNYNILISTDWAGVSTNLGPSNASLARLLWGDSSFMVSSVACPN